MTKGVWPTYSL